MCFRLRKTFRVVAVLFLFGPVACSGPMLTPTAQMGIEVTSEPTRQEPTFTPTPPISPPMVESPASPTPTWTPLPTLTINQALDKIYDLDLNNGGCELPCWWGITPNVTTWQEAVHFLASFTEVRQVNDVIFPQNGKNQRSQDMEIYYEVPGEKESRRILISGLDGVVIATRVFPPDTKHSYRLFQLLMLLGQPRQIYVGAQPDSQTNQLLPAYLILDYSNLGVLASYEFPVHRVGNNLEICPAPVGARLELQSPGIVYPEVPSIEEYVSMITGFEPKALADVSQLDVEAFYKTFRNQDSTVCMVTPSNIWP